MSRHTLTLVVAAVLATALAGCVQDAPAALKEPEEPRQAPRDQETGDANEDHTEADSDEPEPQDEDTQQENATRTEDAAEDVPAPSPASVVVTTVNGTMSGVTVGATAGDVNACCARVEPEKTNGTGAFTPDPDLAGIVMELTWTAETADLDAYLKAPDYESHMPPEVNGTEIRGSDGHRWADRETGDGGHAVIRVTDADALGLDGEWSWNVGATVAHEANFTVHVSLFYGQAPADDYTAVSG